MKNIYKQFVIMMRNCRIFFSNLSGFLALSSLNIYLYTVVYPFFKLKFSYRQRTNSFIPVILVLCCTKQPNYFTLHIAYFCIYIYSGESYPFVVCTHELYLRKLVIHHAAKQANKAAKCVQGILTKKT